MPFIFDVIIQSHSLKSSPYQLKRMCYCRWYHSWWNTCCEFVYFHGFELLIQHIIKSSEEPFLVAWSQTSAKIPLETFFFVYINDGSIHATVSMKISKFESGLNNVQRIGNYGTDYSRNKWMQKIMTCMLVLLLKLFQCTEEWITS